MINFIIRIRKHLGMSQEAFAKAIGVAQPTVSLYEKGERFPKPKIMKHIVKLAARHGVKPSVKDLYHN